MGYKRHSDDLILRPKTFVLPYSIHLPVMFLMTFHFLSRQLFLASLSFRPLGYARVLPAPAECST